MICAAHKTRGEQIAAGQPRSALCGMRGRYRGAVHSEGAFGTRFSVLYGLLLFCLTIAMLLVNETARAAPAQPLNYFHSQVWSTEDGLPQASVHALLQTHEGYLWIATEGGAAQFDGQNFVVFSHATVPAFVSDDISCLAEDESGDLWFGSADGLVQKHGGAFRRFTSRDGLPSDQIVALGAGGGELLVLTTGGLARWRSGHFEAIPTSQEINGIGHTQDGPVLVSQKGGLYRWQGGHFVSIRRKGSALLGAALGGNQIVWTYGTDFVQLSSPAGTKTWRTGIDLPGNRVQALYVDGKGSARIGTNRGLVSIDAAPGFAVHQYDALRGESVLSVLVDREGDLWVGTEASGLHALQPRKFATLQGSTSEAVTTVARGSGDVMYFGTRDDGLFRDEEVAVPIPSNKLTSPVILSLAAGSNGEVWAGTPDGLNQIVGRQVRHWTIADGLPDNFVRSVAVSADGSAWAGTRFGLVHIEPGSVETFTTTEGLASDSIGPLLEQGKTGTAAVLWVGTSAGLCEKTGQQFRCISSPYTGSGSIVTALAQDRDGELWVALHGHGLGLVRGSAIDAVRIASMPAEIVGILGDNLGYVWLRSARGLFRAPARDLRACATDSAACRNVRVDTYGRSDGMQSDELAGEGIPPLAEGPDGQLWFATRRGIAVTDPQHLTADPVRPGDAITQARVDGSELDLDKVDKVSPGHRQFSFQFAGISLNNATQCRYMLDGFDAGWIEAGTRRTAYYTNLPPRDYAFRVLCANRDGLWSKDEASFRFRVLSPWYRSAWIYLLAAGLIVLAIIALIQLRVRAERRRFALVLQERTRVAREVHDTLAQDLVSVSLQVEMAAQHAKAGRLNEVSDQLSQTRSLVRQALESARQSIWNLRANLAQDSLPVRLAARVEALRGSKVPVRLRISGEYRSTAAGLENEVMRIASEAIANAERHSGANQIAVELSYGPEALRLKVQDDGCGFDVESARRKADHYGLRGLDERAAVIRASVNVESIPGQGTTVTLEAPLSPERL